MLKSHLLTGVNLQLQNLQICVKNNNNKPKTVRGCVYMKGAEMEELEWVVIKRFKWGTPTTHLRNTNSINLTWAWQGQLDHIHIIHSKIPIPSVTY